MMFIAAESTELLSRLHRRKLFFIFLNIPLILLIYSVWSIKWVVVDFSDFLGLTSHLPAIYWMGLGLITICSIFAYLDNTLNSRMIQISILFILILFLFGVGLFAEENARNVFTYSNIAEVKNIQTVHRIDISSNYPLISYRSWPAYHLLSFSIVSLCKIEIDDLIKYIPLFFIIYYIIFCLAIGQSLGFNANKSYVISLLFTASIFSAHQWYPSPQSLAICFYILLFYLSIPVFIKMKEKNMSYKIMILIAFGAVILTHLLTSTILLLSFFAESLYLKRKDYIIPLVMMYLFYLVYLAPVAFRYGVRSLFTQITTMDFFYFMGTTKFAPITPIKEMVNYFRLSYFGIYVILVVIILVYIYSNKNQRDVYIFKLCMIWIMGAAPLLGLHYGLEIFERMYGFALLPICIIVSLFSERFAMRRLIIPIAVILLIALHIPAHYGSESGDMTLTSELKGADFFSTKAEYAAYLYQFPSIIRYYNHKFTTTSVNKIDWADAEIDLVLDENQYIINSKKTDNFLKYHIGHNPLNNFSLFSNYSKIYYSKFFDIKIKSLASASY